MKTKFELAFTKEFLRRLEQLDKQTQIRILRRLRTLEEKPFVGKRLTGRLTGLLSLRASGQLQNNLPTLRKTK